MPDGVEIGIIVSCQNDKDKAISSELLSKMEKTKFPLLIGQICRTKNRYTF